MRTSIFRKIYLYYALTDFVLLYPLYNVMFSDRGLSTLQISSLLIIWSLTDLLVNVPVGVLADKYSRKNLLGIGELIKAAGFACWFLAPDYLGFALGFVLWGTGGALSDGTFEALVFDELKAANRQQEYVKVIGRAKTFAQLAILASTALAAAAVLAGYWLIIWGSVATTVFAALVAFSLPETKRVETVAETGYFAMLGAAAKEAIGNRLILNLIFIGAFIGMIFGVLEEYIPLVIKDLGASRSTIALLETMIGVAAALAAFVAHRYQHLRTSAFMVLLAISGLALVALDIHNNIAIIALLVVYTLIIETLNTIYGGKLQHSIKSHMRATITSISGFVLELLSIGAYVVYGLIADHSSNLATFRVFGVAVIMVAAAYLLFGRKIFPEASR